jgi:hypothetical protein
MKPERIFRSLQPSKSAVRSTRSLGGRLNVSFTDQADDESGKAILTLPLPEAAGFCAGIKSFGAW